MIVHFIHIFNNSIFPNVFLTFQINNNNISAELLIQEKITLYFQNAYRAGTVYVCNKFWLNNVKLWIISGEWLLNQSPWHLTNILNYSNAPYESFLCYRTGKAAVNISPQQRSLIDHINSISRMRFWIFTTTPKC